MTTAADGGRLGILEGRMTEQAAAIAGLRDDIRDLRAEMRDIRADMCDLRAGLSAVNSRIDRLFLAVLTIGAGVGASQVGLLVTLILRT